MFVWCFFLVLLKGIKDVGVGKIYGLLRMFVCINGLIGIGSGMVICRLASYILPQPKQCA